MTWDIAAAGTIALDDVTTPHGRTTNQLGGSAVYFTLAAARYTTVHVISTVGADSEEQLRVTLAHPRIGCESIAVSDAPTYRWQAVHDFDTGVTATENAEFGAFQNWNPHLLIDARTAPVLFIGSMMPERQKQVLHQSQARIVALDSMSTFIDTQRDDVLKLARAADFLFLNRAELAMLTQSPPAEWEVSARRLCHQCSSRAVIVKAGPDGAACVTATHTIVAPPRQVAQVIDPTGAGDSLAGGFLGTIAARESDGEEIFRQALDNGVHCAADAISQFGIGGLLLCEP